MKRTLSVLALTGGAALALTPLTAHAADGADGATLGGQPPLKRVVDIVDHPGQAVTDAKTAIAVTGAAASGAAKSTNTSLAGAGDALDAGVPDAPKVKG
ncbi:hypothetical protein ACFY7H_27555 [Streptomyces sp. NPDC012794]|uniref:hypothetical protein n=1 Tax=Streptomyces sp. NPDC012794 TaxID=3364850 RepID=UPI0036807FAE